MIQGSMTNKHISLANLTDTNSKKQMFDLKQLHQEENVQKPALELWAFPMWPSVLCLSNCQYKSERAESFAIT